MENRNTLRIVGLVSVGQAFCWMAVVGLVFGPAPKGTRNLRVRQVRVLKKEAPLKKSGAE
jgi:hypothetical protein